MLVENAKTINITVLNHLNKEFARIKWLLLHGMFCDQMSEIVLRALARVPHMIMPACLTAASLLLLALKYDIFTWI